MESMSGISIHKSSADEQSVKIIKTRFEYSGSFLFQKKKRFLFDFDHQFLLFAYKNEFSIFFLC